MEFFELYNAFIKRNEDWKDAEEAIVNLRSKIDRVGDPISKRLSSVVSDEVHYQYAMWNGDYEKALECAKKVSDALGGDETKGYRGWWYFLAAEAAIALYDVTAEKKLIETAKDLLKRASGCCIAISLFSQLSRSLSSKEEIPGEDETIAIAVEKIRKKLSDLGGTGTNFEVEVSKLFKDIQSTDHKEFHLGLKVLGEMLGFKAEIPEGDGAPDCIWSIVDFLYIVHEAKSDQSPDDKIGVTDVRQAQSHENWIKSKCPVSKNVKIIPVIESPREIVDTEALPHSKTLSWVQPAQMKVLCDQIVSILRRVRATTSNLNDEKILEFLRKEIIDSKLTPLDIFNQLSQKLVSEMKTTKKEIESKKK